MIRAWLIRLCTWVLERCRAEVLVLSPGVLAALPTAVLFVREAHDTRVFGYASGAFKHAHVFAKLVRRFPEADPQDLGLAIEIAVRRGL